MLQHPGKAYQESWKVECLCLPVVRCPRLWGVVFAHVAGLLQIVLSGREGQRLPPPGLRWIVARIDLSTPDPTCAGLDGGCG